MGGAIDNELLTTWIRDMAETLRQQPGQFNFTIAVTAIGTQVTGAPGGPGLIASAVGGQAGSQTVGFISSASPQINGIEIRQAANAAAEQQVSDWANQLDAIAAALASNREPGFIRRTLEDLKAQAFPTVVLNLVSSLIGLAVGI